MQVGIHFKVCCSSKRTKVSIAVTGPCDLTLSNIEEVSRIIKNLLHSSVVAVHILKSTSSSSKLFIFLSRLRQYLLSSSHTSIEVKSPPTAMMETSFGKKKEAILGVYSCSLSWGLFCAAEASIAVAIEQVLTRRWREEPWNGFRRTSHLITKRCPLWALERVNDGHPIAMLAWPILHSFKTLKYLVDDYSVLLWNGMEQRERVSKQRLKPKIIQQ